MKRAALPRGKPLRRGAPIPRSTAQLQRGERIAPISDRRRRERDQRLDVVEEVRRRDGDGCAAAEVWPEVGCGGPMDTHELAGRGVRPGGHLDASNAVRVCRAHHRAITDNPALAHERGMRRWSWES